MDICIAFCCVPHLVRAPVPCPTLRCWLRVTRYTHPPRRAPKSYSPPHSPALPLACCRSFRDAGSELFHAPDPPPVPHPTRLQYVRPPLQFWWTPSPTAHYLPSHTATRVVRRTFVVADTLAFQRGSGLLPSALVRLLIGPLSVPATAWTGVFTGLFFTVCCVSGDSSCLPSALCNRPCIVTFTTAETAVPPVVLGWVPPGAHPTCSVLPSIACGQFSPRTHHLYRNCPNYQAFVRVSRRTTLFPQLLPPLVPIHGMVSLI